MGRLKIECDAKQKLQFAMQILPCWLLMPRQALRQLINSSLMRFVNLELVLCWLQINVRANLVLPE